jgi:hypothetical protein
MMYQNTGYGAANPQTKYAALGCALALLGFVLLMAIVFVFGAAMG